MQSKTRLVRRYVLTVKSIAVFSDESGLTHKHICRRQYVTALLSSGVSLNTVRESCGHVSSKTTLDCYNYDMSSDEEKIKQFSNALNWAAKDM